MRKSVADIIAAACPDARGEKFITLVELATALVANGHVDNVSRVQECVELTAQNLGKGSIAAMQSFFAACRDAPLPPQAPRDIGYPDPLMDSLADDAALERAGTHRPGHPG